MFTTLWKITELKKKCEVFINFIKISARLENHIWMSKDKVNFRLYDSCAICLVPLLLIIKFYVLFDSSSIKCRRISIQK